MKIIKKILVMTLLMTVILPCSYTSAASDSADTTVKGIYTHLSNVHGGDADDIFYYSDRYFATSAATYDPHLSTMSLCMAMSAMNSSIDKKNNYQNKSVNIRHLLDRIGCEDISVNEDFVSKPGTDTIGVAIAHKTITIGGEDYTLMPVAIRGAGYEQEWIGNMHIGSSGDAAGFATAADHAMEFVEDYISEFDIDTAKTKFWIVGFSRSAAVTDILTHLITDKYNSSGDRVYGYSFATPRAAYERSRSYPNSHCIINPSDLVPYLVPEYLGFTHYGNEVYIPENDTPSTYDSEKSSLKNQLSGLSADSLYDDKLSPSVLKATYAVSISDIFKLPDGYTIEELNSISMTQSECVDRLMSALAGGVAADRKTLTQTTMYDDTTIEDVLSAIVRFTMTSDPKNRSKLVGELSTIKQDKSMLELIGISLDFEDVVEAVHDGYADLDEEKKEEISSFLWELFEPHLKNNLHDAQYKSLKKKWRTAVYVFMELAHYDYTHSEVEGLVTIGTLIHNISLVSRAHSPELYMAWARTKDSHYSSDTTPVQDSVETRVLRMGDVTDIDADIYENSVAVAHIEHGIVTQSDDENIYTGYVFDKADKLIKNNNKNFYTISGDSSEKALNLDKTKDYTVALTARDADEDTEFLKWVDESGNEISASKTININISSGKADYTYIKPLYRTVPAATPTPEPTARPEKENTDEQTSTVPVLPIAGAVFVIIGALSGIYFKKRKH